jgi:hypothetical protein
MSWFCWFVQCQWVHIRGGLYQCTRCKTVSVGYNRDSE